MIHTFPARYPGECAECGSSFEENEEIGYVDDEICCEDCCDSAVD